MGERPVKLDKNNLRSSVPYSYQDRCILKEHLALTPAADNIQHRQGKKVLKESMRDFSREYLK